MPNTSGYKYTEAVQEHTIFYTDNLDGKVKTKKEKGLMPFGAQTGILTEDQLTPEIVEYLLNKKDSDGTLLHGVHLVKDKKGAAKK